MERLTKRTETGVAYLADPITLRSSMEDRGKVHTMIDRLADYEDTDRTPDEIEKLKKKALSLKIYKAIGTTVHLRELVEAEQEGRLVVLPCKVGDTVWRIKRSFETCPYVGKPYVDEDVFLYQDLPNFGKTVFLTREEAENELRGGVSNEDRR